MSIMKKKIKKIRILIKSNVYIRSVKVYKLIIDIIIEVFKESFLFLIFVN